MKKNGLGALCLSLAASIWGGMYVVSKYVLDFVPPITLVWLRYIVAFGVLYAVLKGMQWKTKQQERIRKKDWFLLIWIGFIGYFVSISLQFIGTKWSDAHTGALITSATPAFIVLFARFVLQEKLTARKLLSLFLATIGVILVIGWDTRVGSYFWGSISLVGAAISWALLSVYVKVASDRFSTLTITTYAIFFAMIFTTPIMIWEVQVNPVTLNDWLVISGVLYLGIVSTAGAFFLWNKGMELMDAGIGSLFFFFQPVVGSLLGWLLLGEQLNVNFFIGGCFILVGVLVVTIQPEKE
ncbi:DMT family transporter [Thermoflavimicrobium dichotomicum]|uniref:Permease of the drug/metabolite transporter (DMT) superfamily n=1 Tax=Thermoflavimicrobium dichotomicum TaxID=46223 RepID=A0A1I3LMU6_9BACL|nr:DMT family transporter [Thermoflavimicrobium dichotomicum]SFI86051.1 Permease of the drug/metabolite transporter (DMT) superfamily [Thermoflavimicrobium dichotomicum]